MMYVYFSAKVHFFFYIAFINIKKVGEIPSYFLNVIDFIHHLIITFFPSWI